MNPQIITITVDGHHGTPVDAVYAAIKEQFVQDDFKVVYDNQKEVMLENPRASICLKKQKKSFISR